MRYNVSLSEGARQDLRNIKTFLHDQVLEGLAPDNLPQLTLDYIKSQIHQLELFPKRFPIIDIELDMRRMVLDKYRYSVFYRVIEDINNNVKIYYIRHQAQESVFMNNIEPPTEI